MSITQLLNHLVELEFELAGRDAYNRARQEAQEVLDLLGYGRGDGDEFGDLIHDNAKAYLSLALLRMPGGSENLRNWLRAVRDNREAEDQ
jgi:hypothetical protein